MVVLKLAAATRCLTAAHMSQSGVTCAGDGRVDLQIRLVPALSLDPDGVNSYAAVGRMKETGERWPSGYTLQLIAVRPK